MSDRMPPPDVTDPPEPGTASGLDERQIAPADLDFLQAACRIHELFAEQPAAAIPAGLAAGQVTARAVEIEPAGYQRIRPAPLPDRCRVRRVNIVPPPLKRQRDLPLALAQPIRRRRLQLIDLPERQAKLLHRKLFERYGDQAEQMRIEAVFPHVPSEAVGAIRLAPDLSQLTFTLPEDVSPRSIKPGSYLVIISDAGVKTRNVFFRL
ncbi:hypothetical protein JW859_00425 [bacterium]|nr:hypothetical protein [bacterium]